MKITIQELRNLVHEAIFEAANTKALKDITGEKSEIKKDEDKKEEDELEMLGGFEQPWMKAIRTKLKK